MPKKKMLFGVTFSFKEQTWPAHRHIQPRPQLVRQLILKLSPDGLLVAPGRLEHVMLDQDAREPILIVKKSQFTTLLARSAHERHLHAGVRDTIVALHERFWLPSAWSEIARVLKWCVNCRYQIGGAYKLPPSPPLPDFCLNRVKPFSTVGIDFTVIWWSRMVTNREMLRLPVHL